MTPENRFANYPDLIGNDPFGHRKLILNCLNAAIEAVLPESLINSRLSVDSNEVLSISGTDQTFDLKSYDRVIVVGCGKAGGTMARTMEKVLPENIQYFGTVVVPAGASSEFRLRRIKLVEGTHPTPTEKSVRATAQILNDLSVATKNSLVICLVSGGGSALMASPAEGITLRDKINTTRLLLKSGATIEQLNCVRKHLSRVKGGQLARAANGARLVTLILSDIVGNPIESISSGPTAPDPTTFKDALEVLKEFHLEKKVPDRVLQRLKKGSRGDIAETLKPGDRIFENVSNIVIGDNSLACAAMLTMIQDRHAFSVHYLGSHWQGESRDTAANLSGLFITASEKKGASGLPLAFVWGGETTVTVRGKGKGGRNQEEALGAILKLRHSRGITVAFMGTDGIDGFSEAAGALVQSADFERAYSRGLVPETFLKNNDSNSFFRKLGASLLVTGPTGTNVDDVGVALVELDAG